MPVQGPSSSQPQTPIDQPNVNKSAEFNDAKADTSQVRLANQMKESDNPKETLRLAQNFSENYPKIPGNTDAIQTGLAAEAHIVSMKNEVDTKISKVESDINNIEEKIEEWQGDLQGASTPEAKNNLNINIDGAKQKIADLEVEKNSLAQDLKDYGAAYSEIDSAISRGISLEENEAMNAVFDEFLGNIQSKGNIEGKSFSDDSALLFGKAAIDAQVATPPALKQIVSQIDMQQSNSLHTCSASMAVIEGRIENKEKELEATDSQIDSAKARITEFQNMQPETEDLQSEELTAATAKVKLINNSIGDQKIKLASLEAKKDEITKERDLLKESLFILEEKIEGHPEAEKAKGLKEVYKNNLEKTGALDGAAQKEASPLKGRATNWTDKIKRMAKEGAGDPALKHLFKSSAPPLLKGLLTSLFALVLMPLFGPFGLKMFADTLANELKGIAEANQKTIAEQQKLGFNPLKSLGHTVKNITKETKVEGELANVNELEEDDSVDDAKAKAEAKAKVHSEAKAEAEKPVDTDNIEDNVSTDAEESEEYNEDNVGTDTDVEGSEDK